MYKYLAIFTLQSEYLIEMCLITGPKTVLIFKFMLKTIFCCNQHHTKDLYYALYLDLYRTPIPSKVLDDPFY